MDAERLFWSHVDRNGPIAIGMKTRCWVWTEAVFRKRGGYGVLTFRGRRGSKAHRIAWELMSGPTKRWVLHRCDTPTCVRPSHLFLGDAKSNAADMAKKGRTFNQRKARCPRGHLLDGVTTRGSGERFRYCKVCSRVNGKANKALRRRARGILPRRFKSQ